MTWPVPETARSGVGLDRIHGGFESRLGIDVRRFKPGRGDVFLGTIKIRSTPSFGWEVKPEVPCRKILRHVKDPLTKTLNTRNSHSFVHTSYSLQMFLLVGLPERSLC
jgi:hypothetical protein